MGAIERNHSGSAPDGRAESHYWFGKPRKCVKPIARVRFRASVDAGNGLALTIE